MTNPPIIRTVRFIGNVKKAVNTDPKIRQVISQSILELVRYGGGKAGTRGTLSNDFGVVPYSVTPHSHINHEQNTTNHLYYVIG